MHRTLHRAALLPALLLIAACESPAVSVPEAGPHAHAPRAAASFDPAAAPQLAAAREGTAQYHRLEAALADGYVDIGVVIPGMGSHYLNPALLDGAFDPARPEILVYASRGGRMRLVAVEYAVPLGLSAAAPAGFAGEADGWERAEAFGLWTLHAWVWLDNPAGLFAPLNPRLP